MKSPTRLLDHGSGDGMNKMLSTGGVSSARSDAVHSPQHHSGTRTSPNPAFASTGHPYAAPSPFADLGTPSGTKPESHRVRGIEGLAPETMIVEPRIIRPFPYLGRMGTHFGALLDGNLTPNVGGFSFKRPNGVRRMTGSHHALCYKDSAPSTSTHVGAQECRGASQRPHTSCLSTTA
jgi:hypothetical protein